jgi:hypothetical protein
MPAWRISAPTHKGTLGGASATSIETPVTSRTFHSSSRSRLCEVLWSPTAMLTTDLAQVVSARSRRLWPTNGRIVVATASLPNELRPEGSGSRQFAKEGAVRAQTDDCKQDRARLSAACNGAIAAGPTTPPKSKFSPSQHRKGAPVPTSLQGEISLEDPYGHCRGDNCGLKATLP